MSPQSKTFKPEERLVYVLDQPPVGKIQLRCPACGKTVLIVRLAHAPRHDQWFDVDEHPGGLPDLPWSIDLACSRSRCGFARTYNRRRLIDALMPAAAAGRREVRLP